MKLIIYNIFKICLGKAGGRVNRDVFQFSYQGLM